MTELDILIFSLENTIRATEWKIDFAQSDKTGLK